MGTTGRAARTGRPVGWTRCKRTGGTRQGSITPGDWPVGRNERSPAFGPHARSGSARGRRSPGVRRENRTCRCPAEWEIGRDAEHWSGRATVRDREPSPRAAHGPTTACDAHQAANRARPADPDHRETATSSGLATAAGLERRTRSGTRAPDQLWRPIAARSSRPSEAVTESERGRKRQPSSGRVQARAAGFTDTDHAAGSGRRSGASSKGQSAV